MRRIAPALFASLLLYGCVSPEPIPSLASTQGAKAEMQRVLADIVQGTVAARTKFLDEHPNNPYRTAINNGFIEIGMNADEVAAAGFGCDVKEQSTVGSVQACQNVLPGATGPAYIPAPTYYVGFDKNDKVVSIQNP